MGFDVTEIFAFEIPGKLKKHVDPQVVRRVMMAKSAGRFYQWVQQSKEITKALESLPMDDYSEQAIAQIAELSARQSDVDGKISEVAYQAFGLQPIDGSTGEGITEATLFEIVQAYLEWLEEKKDDAGVS